MMEGNNNRYTGKRWAGREEMENRGNTFEKKNAYGNKTYGGRNGKSSDRYEGKSGYDRSNGEKRNGGKTYGRTEENKDYYRRDDKREYRKDSKPEYRKEYKKDFKRDNSAENREEYGRRTEGRKEERTYNKPYEKSFDRGNAQKRGFDRNTEEKAREKYISKDAEETVNTQAGGEDVLPFLIIGRNAVREALKSERSIDKILVVPEHDGSLNEILSLAKDNKVIIRETDKKKLDEVCMPFGHGGKTANHQGIVAYAAGMEYCSVSDILHVAKERNEDPFVIVLDGVEDPHNLGSIIRSAECAGAHGVVIGKRRSASVTAAAVKAAAGATAYMKVARVTNVTGALEEMKRAGLWIAGADMSGVPMHKQGMNGPLAIVIGGEGGGLTKLVKDTCDFLISIPMKGRINSLNASVAAAVLMFEKKRQDAVEE